MLQDLRYRFRTLFDSRAFLFYQQVAERAATLPGVQRAAVARDPPLAGGFLRSIFPEGLDTTNQEATT